MPDGCRIRMPGGEACGKPLFSTGGCCEDHLRARYPVTYARLKRERKCEQCLGTGQVPGKNEYMTECPGCGGRGIVDPGYQGRET